MLKKALLEFTFQEKEGLNLSFQKLDFSRAAAFYYVLPNPYQRRRKYLPKYYNQTQGGVKFICPPKVLYRIRASSLLISVQLFFHYWWQWILVLLKWERLPATSGVVSNVVNNEASQHKTYYW